MSIQRCVLLVVVVVGWLSAALGCEETAPWSETAVAGGGIVNGTPTGYTEWQGAVAVLIEGRICSGTLIHPAVVATAGHCVYFLESGIDVRNNPGQVEVVGGANLQRFSSIIAYPPVEQIVIHDKWSGSINDLEAVDLALIKLSAPIVGVEVYGLRSAPEPHVDDAGKLVGYGLTDEKATESWGVHRVGDAEIYNYSTELFEVGGGSGTCGGDSGGPFFTQQNGAWVLTGVTSFGLGGDCTVNGSNWNVNVYTFRAWYDAQLRALVGEGLPDTGEPFDSGGDTATSGQPDAGTDTGEHPGCSSCALGARPSEFTASILFWLAQVF